MRAILLRPFTVLAVMALTVTTQSAHRGWDPLGDAKNPAAPSEATMQTQEVIVRALTSAGQPVTDLKPDEVTIRTDGRERKVKSLELVTVPAGGAPEGGAATAAAPASKLPAPFATNAGVAAVAEGGRDFLLIIDEEGIGPGREEPVRNAVAQLAAHASPSDRFGMISRRPWSRTDWRNSSAEARRTRASARWSAARSAPCRR